MIGVNPQRKLRAELTHIIGGEYAALADLMLNAGAHVDHPGSSEIGRQQATEIRQAVLQRVDVRAARHCRLRRLKLRLKVLNGRGDRADRLSANLGRDIKRVD